MALLVWGMYVCSAKCAGQWLVTKNRLNLEVKKYFKILSEKNMEFVQESSEGSENIWIASSDGDVTRVMELLSEGVSVNAQDDMGYSPL